MASIIDPHAAEIPVLCKRYGVHRLELFGSATTDAFDSATSDIDFLVELDSTPLDLFTHYLSLKESLEALYGRNVDLVMTGAMRNKYFIDVVTKTRQLVYVAENTKAA
jgi:uncharacterized protein